MEGAGAFRVRFDPAVHQPQDVALQFCRDRAADLGIATEEELLARCVPHYARLLESRMSSA